MGKTNQSVFKYQGYKFFKERPDGDFDIIRITRVSEWNDKVTYKNEDTGEVSEAFISDIKDYTPLSPIGYIVFGDVTVADNTTGELSPDVIVTVFKLLDVKMGMTVPYAICRQSVTDFFYTLFSTTEEHEYVGVSASKDDCIANIPYEDLMMCNSINSTQIVNFYLDDTVDTILDCIDTKVYDKTLLNLYIKHMKSKNMLFELTDQSPMEEHGWCQNLKTLLTINNFITDLDSLREITCFGFELEPELVDVKDDNGETHKAFNPLLLKFFSQTFKVNAINTYVIPYYYDIDLAEFNNTNRVLIRDSADKLYLVVYLAQGEYLEKDLFDKANEPNLIEKYRLGFYDKYNN